MLKNINIIIVLFCYLYSSTIYAVECSKRVTTLNTGDKSPCTGFLFSPEAEREIWTIKENNKLFQKEIELKDKKTEILDKQLKIKDLMIENKDEQVILYHTKLVETTKKYIESEENRGTRDLLFIALGVLLTVTASVVVKNVSK